jgi:Flp pilus assembly protein CpaB
MERREETLDVTRAVLELHQRALAILARAEQSGDLPTALRGIRECRSNLELVARLTGDLDAPIAPTSGPVNIVVTYVDKAVMLPGATPQLVEGGSEDDE